MVMSFNGNVTAILGDGLGSLLGKKGTASDITLYNHKQGDVILSFVEPTTYPDKIQSLVSALNISDQVLLKADIINPELAEKLVAVDMMGIQKGYLAVGEGVDANILEKLIEGTVAKGYERVELQAAVLREKLAANIPDPKGDAIVQIDHSFQVKGVGTVALGVVKQGTVRKYDTLNISPSGGHAILKSVQVHDVDVLEAGNGVRVGLALKDVRPEDVPRGSILAKNPVTPIRELDLEFTLSKYAQKNLVEGDQLTVNHVLNYTPAKITSGNLSKGNSGRLRITLEKPLPNVPGRVLLFDPCAKMHSVFGYASLM